MSTFSFIDYLLKTSKNILRYAKGLLRHLKSSHGLSESAAKRECIQRKAPVVCMICQTMLKGPRAAARHKKKYHTDGDYPCKKCGRDGLQQSSSTL